MTLDEYLPRGHRHAHRTLIQEKFRAILHLITFAHQTIFIFIS